MAIFNSYVANYQRVIVILVDHLYHDHPITGHPTDLRPLHCSACFSAFFAQENSVIGKHGFPSLFSMAFHGFPLTFSWNQFSECCLKPTKHRWRLRCHQLQLGNQCLELPEFVVLALWPHSPVPCYNMGVKIGTPMLPSFLAGNLTKKPGMSVLYPLVN